MVNMRLQWWWKFGAGGLLLGAVLLSIYPFLTFLAKTSLLWTVPFFYSQGDTTHVHCVWVTLFVGSLPQPPSGGFGGGDAMPPAPTRALLLLSAGVGVSCLVEVLPHREPRGVLVMCL